MNGKTIVNQFENEFKNKANINVVDELMSENFVHHNNLPNIPEGREGLKAIGQFVFSVIEDIRVEVTQLIQEGDTVASRIEATGVLKSNGQHIEWTENHLYRIDQGKIIEWWPEGGPQLN